MPGDAVVSGEKLLDLLVGSLFSEERVKFVEISSGPSEIGAIVGIQMERAVPSGDKCQ